MRKETKDETTVTVLDQKISNHQYQSGNIAWGIFLVFAGTLFLLNTLNYVPWEVWNYIIRFWPVLLILAGLQIILGNSFISRSLMTLLTIFVFLIIFLEAIDRMSPQLTRFLPDSIKQFTGVLDNFAI